MTNSPQMSVLTPHPGVEGAHSFAPDGPKGCPPQPPGFPNTPGEIDNQTISIVPAGGFDSPPLMGGLAGDLPSLDWGMGPGPWPQEGIHQYCIYGDQSMPAKWFENMWAMMCHYFYKTMYFGVMYAEDEPFLWVGDGNGTWYQWQKISTYGQTGLGSINIFSAVANCSGGDAQNPVMPTRHKISYQGFAVDQNDQWYVDPLDNVVDEIIFPGQWISYSGVVGPSQVNVPATNPVPYLGVDAVEWVLQGAVNMINQTNWVIDSTGGPQRFFTSFFCHSHPIPLGSLMTLAQVAEKYPNTALGAMLGFNYGEDVFEAGPECGNYLLNIAQNIKNAFPKP